MGRKRTVGNIVRQKARERAMTVSEIHRETGIKPNTIRVVLNQAAAKGEFVLERFRQGASNRAIKAISHDEGIEVRLNGLICGLCGASKVEG